MCSFEVSSTVYNFLSVWEQLCPAWPISYESARGWGVKVCSISVKSIDHLFSLTFCLTLCLFVNCQIFSRDSFGDIYIIDIFIHSSRDRGFIEKTSYFLRTMVMRRRLYEVDKSRMFAVGWFFSSSSKYLAVMVMRKRSLKLKNRMFALDDFYFSS